jgi:signal transduction histidine kinase
MDIAENAIRASARRITIVIVEDEEKDELTLEITDDGRGMDKKTSDRALDPFFTSKDGKRMGLGLPLLAQSAREAGGKMELESAPGKGTTVRASFRYKHPDRRPLGRMDETMIALIAGNPQVDFVYEHMTGGSVYRLDSREMRTSQ